MNDVSDADPTSRMDWAFYAQYGEVMKRAAVDVLGKDSVLGVSADDVVHQVVIELMTKGFGSDEIRNMAAFLYRRTQSRARDAKKRGRHQPDLPEDVQPKSDADVQLSVDQASESESIFDAVGHLGDRDRIVIIERVMKKREAKEVAEDLGVSPQRIAQLQKRALDQLRADDTLMAALNDHDTTHHPGQTS